jgi:hypothetical protein
MLREVAHALLKRPRHLAHRLAYWGSSAGRVVCATDGEEIGQLVLAAGGDGHAVIGFEVGPGLAAPAVDRGGAAVAVALEYLSAQLAPGAGASRLGRGRASVGVAVARLGEFAAGEAGSTGHRFLPVVMPDPDVGRLVVSVARPLPLRVTV